MEILREETVGVTTNAMEDKFLLQNVVQGGASHFSSITTAPPLPNPFCQLTNHRPFTLLTLEIVTGNGEENDRRERVYLVAATFSTEGWATGAQYPCPNLKIKALLNKHSKTQKRNYSGETSLRHCIVSLKSKNNQMPYLEHSNT